MDVSEKNPRYVCKNLSLDISEMRFYHLAHLLIIIIIITLSDKVSTTIRPTMYATHTETYSENKQAALGFKYNMCGQELESVMLERDLAVHVSSDLNCWKLVSVKKHIVKQVKYLASSVRLPSTSR